MQIIDTFYQSIDRSPIEHKDIYKIFKEKKLTEKSIHLFIMGLKDHYFPDIQTASTAKKSNKDISINKLEVYVQFFRRLSIAKKSDYIDYALASEKEIELKDSLDETVENMLKLKDEVLFKRCLNDHLLNTLPENVKEKNLHCENKYLKAQISDFIKEREEVKALPHLKKRITGKILAWAIPAVIIAVTIYGIINGDYQKVRQIMLIWILLNGSLCFLGALFSRSHWLVILLAFPVAPLTSLNPGIGAGMVLGALQFYLKPPEDEDIKNLFWEADKRKRRVNGLVKVFNVFLWTSIGSAAGSIIALRLILPALSSGG